MWNYEITLEMFFFHVNDGSVSLYLLDNYEKRDHIGLIMKIARQHSQEEELLKKLTFCKIGWKNFL